MCCYIREFKLNFDNSCRKIQLLKLRSFNSTFQIQFDNENYSTKRFRGCWNSKYKEFTFKSKSIKVRKHVRQRYFVKKLFPFFKFYKYFLIKDNNFSKINYFIKRNNYIKFISPFLINYYSKVRNSKLSRNLKKLSYNSKRKVKQFNNFFRTKSINFFKSIYIYANTFFNLYKEKNTSMKKKYYPKSKVRIALDNLDYKINPDQPYKDYNNNLISKNSFSLKKKNFLKKEVNLLKKIFINKFFEKLVKIRYNLKMNKNVSKFKNLIEIKFLDFIDKKNFDFIFNKFIANFLNLFNLLINKSNNSLFFLQFNQLKKYFLSLFNKYLFFDNFTIKNTNLFEKIYFNINRKNFNKKGVAAQYKRRKRPLKFFKSVKFKEGGRKKLKRFRKAYIVYYNQFIFNNRKKSKKIFRKFSNLKKFKNSKKISDLKKFKNSKKINNLKRSIAINNFKKFKNLRNNNFKNFNNSKNLKNQNFKKSKKWMEKGTIEFSAFLLRKFLKRFRQTLLTKDNILLLNKHIRMYCRHMLYSKEYPLLNNIKLKKKYMTLTTILKKYHLKNQKNKFDFLKKVSFRNIWLPFFHKRNLRLLKGFKRNLVSLEYFTKSWASLLKKPSSFIYYWYNFYISRAAFLKTKNLSFSIFNSTRVLLGISYIDFFYYIIFIKNVFYILNMYLLHLGLLKKKNYLTYYIMLRDKILFKKTRRKKKQNHFNFINDFSSLSNSSKFFFNEKFFSISNTMSKIENGINDLKPKNFKSNLSLNIKKKFLVKKLIKGCRYFFAKKNNVLKKNQFKQKTFGYLKDKNFRFIKLNKQLKKSVLPVLLKNVNEEEKYDILFKVKNFKIQKKKITLSKKLTLFKNKKFKDKVFNFKSFEVFKKQNFNFSKKSSLNKFLKNFIRQLKKNFLRKKLKVSQKYNNNIRKNFKQKNSRFSLNYVNNNFGKKNKTKFIWKIVHENKEKKTLDSFKSLVFFLTTKNLKFLVVKKKTKLLNESTKSSLDESTKILFLNSLNSLRKKKNSYLNKNFFFFLKNLKNLKIVFSLIHQVNFS